MELIEIIKDRRSVRKWTEDDVTSEELIKLIDAGRWAPSTGNKQSIKFLIIRDKEKRNFLAKIVGGGIGYSHKAPVHILVLINIRGYLLPYYRHMLYLDSGAAIQNMLLMAHSLGLGACWLNWDGSVSHKKEDEVYRKFKIPSYFIITSLILIGHRYSNPEPIPRKQIEEFIVYESFSADTSK